jgi:hypothetical protein
MKNKYNYSCKERNDDELLQIDIGWLVFLTVRNVGTCPDIPHDSTSPIISF